MYYVIEFTVVSKIAHWSNCIAVLCHTLFLILLVKLCLIDEQNEQESGIYVGLA